MERTHRGLPLAVIYGEPGLAQPDELEGSGWAGLEDVLELEVALFEGLPGEVIGSQTVGKVHGMCPGEPLFEEPSLAACSGVRVAPDMVLTARHCVERVPCQSMSVSGLFDGSSDPDAVLSCFEVLFEDEALDVAVIGLDGDPAPGRAVVVPGLIYGPIPAVFVSHPLGVSIRIDLDAQVRPSSDPGQFWARADAFSGSSGGGIFLSDGALAGILVAGLSDTIRKPGEECSRLATLQGSGFEKVVPAALVYELACVQGIQELCVEPRPPVVVELGAQSPSPASQCSESTRS